MNEMTMRAMTSDGTGKLVLKDDVSEPTPAGREVLIEVYSTGINRIDTYMMKSGGGRAFGRVPILGMEISGRVVQFGPDCTRAARTTHDNSSSSSSSPASLLPSLSVGDPVMALLSDSGQAQFVVIDERHVMHKPDHLSYAEAAAIPEQWLTAYQLLRLVGQVQQGDRVLIHAGASGVGTTAIQLCRLFGAIPYITAGSTNKIQKCIELGAEDGFNYKEKVPWYESLLSATDNTGMDVILDCVGGTHAKGNVSVLAPDGRWVLFGLMGGPGLLEPECYESFLGDLMKKRASLRSTSLRSRSKEYKANLIERFVTEVLPYINSNSSHNSTTKQQPCQLKLVVDSMYPLEQAEEAYHKLQANLNVGKIILTVHEDHNDTA